MGRHWNPAVCHNEQQPRQPEELELVSVARQTGDLGPLLDFWKKKREKFLRGGGSLILTKTKD